MQGRVVLWWADSTGKIILKKPADEFFRLPLVDHWDPPFSKQNQWGWWWVMNKGLGRWDWGEISQLQKAYGIFPSSLSDLQQWETASCPPLLRGGFYYKSNKQYTLLHRDGHNFATAQNGILELQYLHPAVRCQTHTSRICLHQAPGMSVEGWFQCTTSTNFSGRCQMQQWRCSESVSLKVHAQVQFPVCWRVTAVEVPRAASWPLF